MSPEIIPYLPKVSEVASVLVMVPSAAAGSPRARGNAAADVSAAARWCCRCAQIIVPRDRASSDEDHQSGRRYLEAVQEVD